MFPVFQSGFGKIIMRPYRSDNSNRIDIGRLEYFRRVSDYPHIRIIGSRTLLRVRALIADRDQSCRS